MADLNDLLNSIVLAERSLRQRLNTAESRQISQALDYAAQEARKAGQALSSYQVAPPADKASIMGMCARHLSNSAGAVSQAIGSSPELNQVLIATEQLKAVSRELSSAEVGRRQQAAPAIPTTTGGSAETAKTIAERLDLTLEIFQQAAPAFPTFQREGARMVYSELDRLAARLNAVAQGTSDEWTSEVTARFWMEAQQKLRALAGYVHHNGLSGYAPGLAVLADKAREGLEQLRQEYRETGSTSQEVDGSLAGPPVNQETPPVQAAQPRRIAARPSAEATRPLRQPGEPRSAPTSPAAVPAALPSPAQALRQATDALGKVHFADADSMRSLYGVSEDAAQALADSMPGIVDRLNELAARIETSGDPAESHALWNEARRVLTVLETGVYDNVTEVRGIKSVLRKEGGLREVNVGGYSGTLSRLHQGHYR